MDSHWVSENWILDQQKQEALEGATFILIARDYLQGFVIHHLMLIKIQEGGGVAERATVLELLVPVDDLDILEECRPRRRRIVLV